MASPEVKQGSPIAVIAALVANIGIAAAKFVAAFLTGSSAMLAEGIHSLVDTSNEAVLIVGVRRARRPPDDLHQFGHGKEIYFWTLVVAVLLFAIGGGLAFYEGLTHFVDPHPIDNVLDELRRAGHLVRARGRVVGHRGARARPLIEPVARAARHQGRVSPGSAR